jgi:hypothetical protein
MDPEGRLLHAEARLRHLESMMQQQLALVVVLRELAELHGAQQMAVYERLLAIETTLDAVQALLVREYGP